MIYVLLLAFAGDVKAQEAERAGGPLRYAAQGNNIVYFIVGPAQPPRAPFSAWRWAYLKEPTGESIALAARVLVDCQGKTQQVTRLEAYGRKGFLRSVPPTAEMRAKATPQPGSVLEGMQREACTPNRSASRRTAKDYRDGRVVADRLLGVRATQHAAAPVAQPPASGQSSAAAAALSPTYCRAVAAVMLDSHDKSIKVGKVLLALGPENKMPPAEMAKARAMVADAEAKRKSAQQVLALYSRAPNPDAKLIERIRKSRLAELDAQIERCAATAGAQSKPPVSASQPAGSPKVEYGVGFKGNDIRRLGMLGGNWVACRNACAKESRCKAWTMHSPPGKQGTCELKDKVTSRVANLQSVSSFAASEASAARTMTGAPNSAAAAKLGWMVAGRGSSTGGDRFVEASQVDTTGRFALVYGCSIPSRVRYVRIYTSEAFDDSASYAPDVPVKLAIDGKPATEFSFRFQKMPHFPRVKGAQGRSLETVDVTTRADAKSVDRALATLRSAQSSIAISYFDKAVRFATEPGNASFGKVDAQCAMLSGG